MLFLLIGAAVGAVAGACIAYASDENDRQSSKHHRQVANKLTTDYSSLQNKYHDLVDTTQRYIKEQASLSQKRINDLTIINARNEEEKDLLRLTIRLQQSLYNLMLDIEKEPSKEALTKFEQAILATNTVLSKLNEELFQVSDTYFSHNLERAKKIEEERLGRSIEGITCPVKQCRKCGEKNRVRTHSNNHSPICGNCKCRLVEEIIEAECTNVEVEPNIVQQDRQLLKTPDRDFSGTFATYEPYLNWFCKYFSAVDALSREQFYRSTRYSGTPRSTEKTRYRNNRKSSPALSYLD
jgi:gas vesicle protein